MQHQYGRSTNLLFDQRLFDQPRIGVGLCFAVDVEAEDDVAEAPISPERIAMLKYGIEDVRLFYSNDLRFLAQF